MITNQMFRDFLGMTVFAWAGYALLIVT